jgi:hypothetical protein
MGILHPSMHHKVLDNRLLVALGAANNATGRFSSIGDAQGWWRRRCVVVGYFTLR